MALTLTTQAAATVSGTDVVEGQVTEKATSGTFVLVVSSAATLVGHTLDVFVQHSPDGGTTYDDFVHFTQVLGNGGAKTFLAHWSGLIAPTTAQHAPADAALAAGVLQGPVGGLWRVKYVIVGGTFSFTVKADVRQER